MKSFILERLSFLSEVCDSGSNAVPISRVGIVPYRTYLRTRAGEMFPRRCDDEGEGLSGPIDDRPCLCLETPVENVRFSVI